MVEERLKWCVAAGVETSTDVVTQSVGGSTPAFGKVLTSFAAEKGGERLLATGGARGVERLGRQVRGIEGPYHVSV